MTSRALHNNLPCYRVHDFASDDLSCLPACCRVHSILSLTVQYLWQHTGMEHEATAVPVCRLNLLTSAARLVWLVSTPANNVKRNAALHLLRLHDDRSGLPPHAPLPALAESSGLQPSQLLAVLISDDMFGVLGSHDTSSSSVVYLNAETLITRVYKDTGAFVAALQPNRTGNTDISNKPGKRVVTRDGSAPATRGINNQGRIYVADEPRVTSYMQPPACVSTAQPTLSLVARQIAAGTIANQAVAAQVQQYLNLLALQEQQQLYKRTSCKMTAPILEYNHDWTVASYHNTLARESPTLYKADAFASTAALYDRETSLTLPLLNEIPGAELADITDSHTSDVLQEHVTSRSALKFSADPTVSPPHHRGRVSAVSDLASADQQHTSQVATTVQLHHLGNDALPQYNSARSVSAAVLR